ncbi:MAG: thiol:disulfide interchange protein DsbA/DsbL [Pseudomonadales bacterium]|nr:thiol:disulfide interchange protein DsbA/DsbL [Pseudomonadales bacterium]
MKRGPASVAEWIQSACLCAIMLAGLAFADEFEQGVHYTKIPIPSKTLDPSRVEVVEVFSYACPHCYNFRPLLDAWKNRLPEDVAFRRVHAVFSPSWGRLAQAFHVAESLEALERIHVPLFEAIHEHRLDMSQTDLLARLFEQRAGVDKETFQSAFTTFETQRRVGESMAALRVYRIVASTWSTRRVFRLSSRCSTWLPFSLTRLGRSVQRANPRVIQATTS